jgi:hypothetical protein
VALPNDSKHNEAGFSTIPTDSLYLIRVAQMRYLAIFVLTTDAGQTDTQTTPAAHARTWGNDTASCSKLCLYTGSILLCTEYNLGGGGGGERVTQ